MHATITDVPIELQKGEIETRGDTWDGIRVRHIQLPAGTDLRPLLAGLPGDCCHSAHYGYVVDGSITVRYTDGTEETTRAGEVYVWPAGHVGWTDEGVTFLEFSPAADIGPVLEHLAAAVAAG